MPLEPAPHRTRFRLYIDESGDHVYKHVEEPAHRYLCLLGVWFEHLDYESFHRDLEQLKQELFRPHPDDPVILHREDIVHRRSVFARLQDPSKARLFDERLLAALGAANFRIVAVVIDKKAMHEAQAGSPVDCYNVGVGGVLEQYFAYLSHINCCGDVMVESRGRREDLLLKQSYQRSVAVLESGAFGQHLRRAVTSHEIKVKPKAANISGLQLADLLGHPCRHDTLREFGRTADELGPFARQLLQTVATKFHRDVQTGEVKGSGKRLYPVQ